jgi:hypothetical protein
MGPGLSLCGWTTWVPGIWYSIHALATKIIIVSAPPLLPEFGRFSLVRLVGLVGVWWWFGWLVGCRLFVRLVGYPRARINQSINSSIDVNQSSQVASNAGACGVSTTLWLFAPQALSLLSLHTREGNISSGARRSKVVVMCLYFLQWLVWEWLVGIWMLDGWMAVCCCCWGMI